MRALIVRGGWEGHEPEQTTELFVPLLAGRGFDVVVSGSLAAYADEELMASVDLVVQCWSMGELSPQQSRGLLGTVRRGAGFAGWHGGIVGTFRTTLDYLRLTGGQFVAHPGDFVDHEIVIRPERADHAIVAGFERLELHTEQYWVLSDNANDVLATTTIPAGPDTPWAGPVTVPAIWTRRWGAGRVFVSTIGHHRPDFDHVGVRTITERGLLWAAGRL